MISLKFELTIGKWKICYPKKETVKIEPHVTIKGSDLIIAFNRGNRGMQRNS